ncbi:glycoside hydrolase family 13 protein [Catenuloplanes atrovinosus]|uniref:Alpha-glucosidase n=1 Tax=Catenuloplanes atrovinosus TaxID=137266 RepID=A0AAE4CAX7_9ACTN|nr:glycoside hydrolase family 13 protein [Catenuloplanes atrovinosus]MDR7277528.1 alpha-glucosidase [Catenuloplanes atrovinosus]
MTENSPWWRDAVIYQVYPRSFADSDGDGIGDLPGVISRLPYLAGLGVDAIWLNPFYPSPQADAGYDVADYRDVEPLFGTLADADALIAAAHEAGLRIIVDIVPNHTSSEHAWFRAALAGDASARARYIFREGHGDAPPNGWRSVFGGPAWTRVADGGWYLHLFDAAQPDLDWTNPEVVAEFQDVLRFWLDRGVDGFRIDVAHGLHKDPAFPELPETLDPGLPVHVAQPGHPFWDRDDVHEVWRGWRRVVDAYPGDRTMVAEAWVLDFARLGRYLGPDELHTAFNFAFLVAPWDAGAFRAAIDDTLAGLAPVGAPATWVLSNHDVVRHATRYGGGARGRARARAAALLMLALPGGAYLYQGEELGLEEVLDIPDELRQDPNFIRTNGAERGRDGCRVPIPWSGTTPPFGFSDPAAGTPRAPWLPQPESWAAYTVEAEQSDPDSMLTLYRAALEIRKQRLGEGELEWLSAPGEAMLCFRRTPGDLICAINLGETPAALHPRVAGATPLLTSAPLGADGRLPADAGAWFAG